MKTHIYFVLVFKGRDGEKIRAYDVRLSLWATIWMIVGQGPTALAVGAGGGCLDNFSLLKWVVGWCDGPG